MARMLVRVAVAAAALLACREAPRGARAAGDLVGTYALRDVGGRPLPLFVGGRIIPGEGRTLRGATLVLRPDSQFTAHAAMHWTDSGTVDQSRTVHGTWIVRGNSVVLSYRWCSTYSCTDSVSRRDAGVVTETGLALSGFAGLDTLALGPYSALHFRR